MSPKRALGSNEIDQLIEELDDEKFEVRQRSRRKLVEIGDVVVEELSQRIQITGSTNTVKLLKGIVSEIESSTEYLREVRALGVLEQLGTEAAKKLIRDFSEGASEARITKEAKRIVCRMRKRAGCQ
jgi:hypothetical protein